MKLLDVYHRLPPFLRGLAASAHGWRLDRQRYGPETEELIGQALERESWTDSDWREWQGRRLESLLSRAVADVPYYREQASKLSDPDAIADWPVLSKETVRSRQREFLADDCEPRRMIREHTSGSTGTPLTVWWSRTTSRQWYALVEARIRRWHGVDRRQPWAIFGGQLVAPVSQEKPPFWVWNSPMRQLYLSSYHLERSTIPAYMKALRRHGVKSLLGYPSAMSSLATMALEEGIEGPELEVVFSNAEPLWPHQKTAIEAVFRCPVRDTYGMAELTAAASECEFGSLHPWPEVGHLEVLSDDSDEPVAPGEVGRLVATGLLNQDMPLVRYETGDRLAISAHDATCRCGRALPVIAGIEGRLDDQIITPSGRRIGRLDPVFKGDLPLREAQIVQVEPDRLQVLIVAAPGWDADQESRLATELKQRVGNDMTLEIVVQHHPLERSASGKLRAVISRMPADPPRDSSCDTIRAHR